MMSGLSESYELWVKVMQDAGLSYGPADTLIAHLEEENAKLEAENEALEKKAQGELLVGLYNNDIISQIQFDAGITLIDEEFAARKETPCP